MVANNMKTMLGSGIYTVSEAALYARVSSRMMSRWLFGSGNNRPVVQPQFIAQDKLVSFLDLVQTLAIRELRMQCRLALPKFRQAIEVARDKFGLQYPFAMKNYTFLWEDKIVIQPAEKQFVEASGKHMGNRLLPFIEKYLDDLSFDEADGLATAYRPFKFAGVSIEMRPSIRFGEPLLPSGYTARTIWESIRVEGGIRATAEAFGIPEVEVDAAYMSMSVTLEKLPREPAHQVYVRRVR